MNVATIDYFSGVTTPTLPTLTFGHTYAYVITYVIFIYMYVIVISRYEYDIIVITRVRGGAEDECNNNDIIRVNVI